MSAAAQSSWKPPDADRQPSGWSPPESDRTPEELSPLAKTGKAYSEGLGIPQLLDILRMSNRYGTPQEVAARGERGMTALKGIMQGIAGEPARVWDELSRTGESMLKGDISGTAYHLAGAVPVLGAQSQQAAMDLQRGDPAAFVGHVGAMVTPFVAGPAAGAIEALPEAAQRARVAATGAAQGGWQGATGPTVLPIKVRGVQLAEVPNVPASISGAITGGGVGGLLGGGKGSVIGAVSGATVPIVRGAVKGARSALADLDAIAARAAQEEALANRVPLWEQQGTATTPRGVPQFTPQQPPMGMDLEGNLRPGPLPSGRRVPGEAAEARGPAITPDDVLLLRYLGEKDPLSASAENIGIARDLAKQNPELVNRLRAGTEPTVPPPTATEQAAPTTQAVGTLEYNAPSITPAQERIVKGAQQAGEFTPEEQARANAILENVEPQAAPATAPKPVAADIAAQMRAEMEKSGTIAPGEGQPPVVAEPDVSAVAREAQNAPPALKQEIVNSANYARYLRKQGWTAADAQKMTAAERETLAKAFGQEAPSDAAWEQTLFQMRRVEGSGYEHGVPITKTTTPAEVTAKFEQKRKGPATATAPTPTTDLETQLADSLAGKRTATPPEGPAKPTASETRVETIAKHLAGLEGLNPQYLATLTEDPQGLETLAQLGRDLKVREPQSPGEVQQIVDRVRQLRGEGAAAAPWQVSKAQLVPYSETVPRPKVPHDPSGGYTEAEINARALRNRAAETEAPDITRHPIGSWGIDSTGELMQLREYSLDDPKLIFTESHGKNATVRKYMEWIKEGNEPPPLLGLETEKGSIKIQQGNHRAIAIRETGGDKVKVWTVITRNRPIGGGQVMGEGLTHEATVRNALAEGKPVPPEVLADYADLAKKPQTLRTLMEGEKPAKRPPERASKPVKDPAGMSAAEINRRLDQLDKRSSELTDRMITEGRGHERPSDYAKKTDPLSAEANAVRDEVSDLRNEMARRYGPNAPSRLPRGFGPIKK